MQLIDEKLLDDITLLAGKSPRLRMNYNFHENESDPINRLLNAMNPGSYFPPHRHLNPDKLESFLVLRGSIVIFLFDDEGNITMKREINPKKGVYGMEIPPHVWHSLIVLEPGTVVYEVKPGPYAPLAPENLAPWAPPATDTEAAQRYMNQLLSAE